VSPLPWPRAPPPTTEAEHCQVLGFTASSLGAGAGAPSQKTEGGSLAGEPPPVTSALPGASASNSQGE
jgi:hypothetical protein